MGTTLHAIVEWFSPAAEFVLGDGTKERTLAIWCELGTWDFNKDYPLSIYLNENAENGWPLDSACAGDGDYRYHDERQQWCDVATLEAALVDLQAQKDEDGLPPHTLTLEARIAALQVMQRGDVKLRVMWYRA